MAKIRFLIKIYKENFHKTERSEKWARVEWAEQHGDRTKAQRRGRTNESEKELVARAMIPENK